MKVQVARVMDVEFDINRKVITAVWLRLQTGGKKKVVNKNQKGIIRILIRYLQGAWVQYKTKQCAVYNIIRRANSVFFSSPVEAVIA